ncbi:MAG: fibronectin type III domain-containing protein, partial [Coriobacteriia bacterium]|nr:fibronectin type III domain-containing protein [Coriobacteriia bacterium]
MSIPTANLSVTAGSGSGGGTAGAQVGAGGIYQSGAPAGASTLPTVPQSLRATPGNASATLSWYIPQYTGKPITSYQVSRDGTNWTTVSSGRSFSFTGLTNGTTYTLQVRAVNADGTGAIASTTVTPAPVVPSMPQNPAVAPGPGHVTVSWTAPANNGGSSITSYQVYMSTDNGATFTLAATVNGGQTSANINNLVNGQNYTFQITASNAVGESMPSFTVTGQPQSQPGAPQNLSVIAANQALQLSWTAPSSNGGAVITSYQVSLDGGTTWTNTGSTSTSYTWTGLTNGQTYQLTVLAVNTHGNSQAATPIPGTPMTFPTAPQNLQATLSTAQTNMNLTWTNPLDNGGSAITQFYIQVMDQNGNILHQFDASVPANQLSYTVTGLTPGTSYIFSVAAINQIGTGPAAKTQQTPIGNPGPVQNLQTTPGDSQMTLNWGQPAEDGGAAIQNYVISVFDSSNTAIETSITLDANTFTYTVTGLANGQTYTFDVLSYNGSYYGSNQITAVPATVPGAPSSFTATPSTNQISLSWGAPVDGPTPPDGGSPILSYEVSDDGWQTIQTVPASNPSYIFSNLVNGTTYTFKVRAVNAVGAGPSSTITAVPASVPSAPQYPSYVPGDGQITVSWTTPSDDGGSAIAGYDYSLDGGVSWTQMTSPTPPLQPTQPPFTITGLSNGTTYTVELRAFNANGPGTPSSSFAAVPRTTPSAPQNLTATTNQGPTITLTWDAPASDGGSPITDYAIYQSTDSGQTWTLNGNTGSGTSTSYDPTNLDSGSTYMFAVNAINAQGNGTAAYTDTIVNPIPATAPQNLKATAGNSQISLNWTAPASDGGSAISDYQYSVDGGNNWISMDTTATTFVLTGLTNGLYQNVMVRAYTLAGGGAPSAVAGAVPATAPSAAVGLEAAPGNTTVTINWDPPASTGGNIINWVQVSDDGGQTWTSVASVYYNSYTFTGLTNGQTYLFTVRMGNSMGFGPQAMAVAATPATVPDAPADLTAVGGDSSAALSWSAPADDGGAVITQYTVMQSSDEASWTAVATLAGSVLNTTITGLSNGSTYYYQVIATNSAGNSDPSDTASVTPMTVPTAPQNLLINSSNANVTLTWAAPASNGGSAITAYEVSFDGGANWDTVPNVGDFSYTYTAPPLNVGQLYAYTVRAINVVGAGPEATPQNAEMVALPTAPTNLQASFGDTTADLSWSAPDSDGFSPISEYLITMSSDDGQTWSFEATVAADAMSYQATGLTTGTNYVFAVAAVNAVGTGPAAQTSVTPATTPSVPQNVTLMPGNGTVTLSWTAPATNGGADISDYQVSVNGGPWMSLETTATQATVSTETTTGPALQNGTSYSFSLRAINSVGAGAASDPLSATPRTVPDAPTNLSASIGDSTITLTWSAPDSDGGSAITDYQVSSDGGSTWTDVPMPGALSYSFTGLNNGQNYNLAVRAVNAAGSGAAATTSATPATVPAAVQSLTLTPGDSQVIVSWTAPASDGGSAITSYIVSYRVAGTSTWLDWTPSASAATFSQTVTGLDNGTSYEFTVVAFNAQGPGAMFLPPRAATPAAVPDAPVALTSAPSNQAVTLTWETPASNGATITAYQISNNNGTSWTTIDATSTPSFVFTGLTNGTSYTFDVRAVNIMGAGAAATVTDSPGMAPSAPLNVRATAGDMQVTVTWSTPADSGGRPITAYDVYYMLSTDTTWTEFERFDTLATSEVVTGLTNGVDYLFAVRAVNEPFDEGEISNSAAATPRGVTTAPTDLAAIAGNEQVALSWTAPADDNGSPIDSYLITYWPVDDPGSVVDVSTATTATAFTVTGLTNGVQYAFTVAASNAAGDSAASAEVTATPMTLPDAPTDVMAEQTQPGVVELTWTDGADNGSAITGYEIAYSSDGGASWSATQTASSQPASVSGLVAGGSYIFRVAATNAVGTGGSAQSNTLTLWNVPDAPTGVTALAGPAGGQVELSWTAPDFNGGSTITTYTVYASTTGSIPWTTVGTTNGSTFSYLVSGLNAGSTLYFTVAAQNIVGFSNYATPAAQATTWSVPDAPTDVTATQTDPGVVELTWTDGADNESAITGYEIACSSDGGASWSATQTASSQPASVSGLVAGGSYIFRVAATNSVGTGDSAQSNTITLWSVPDAPTSVSASVESSTSVQVSWTAPANNGGADISGYEVAWS